MCDRQRFVEASSGTVRIGDHSGVLRILRSRDENRQVLVTSMERAEERHSTAAAVEIHQSEVQFATSLTNNLQCIANISRDENDGAGSKKHFTEQSIKVAVARVDENEPC